MNKERRYQIWLATTQTFCVVCGYVSLRIYVVNTAISPWWLIYFFPIFVSFIVSFMLSIFLVMRIDLSDMARISIPATLVYFILYAVVPLVVQFDPFMFVGICSFVVPVALVGFVMNILAVWLGALVHRKIFKH